MPQPSVTNVKALLGGGSKIRVDWERAKKRASANVDVSVFKDGLGPAVDKLNAALKAHSAADNEWRRYPVRPRVGLKPEGWKTGDPYPTVAPEDQKITDGRTKAYQKRNATEKVVKQRLEHLEGVLAGYLALLKKHKASDKGDKLTNKSKKNDLMVQKVAWENLQEFLEQAWADVKKSTSIFDRGEYTKPAP